MNFNSLFYPFENQDLCLWFYYLSIIGFVILVLTGITGLYIGITTKKTAVYYVAVFYWVAMSAIIYFQNRLLYSMCIKSI
jgi:hypothetical protein